MYIKVSRFKSNLKTKNKKIKIQKSEILTQIVTLFYAYNFLYYRNSRQEILIFKKEIIIKRCKQASKREQTTICLGDKIKQNYYTS